MGIQKEIWTSDIEQNMFPENDFLSKIKDESENVLGGKYVHIPQAGAKPVVVKDRTTFPATAGKRTDVVASYPLEWISTNPFHIQNAEQAELSYDKRMSIMLEHIEGLQEYVHTDMAIKYATNAVAASNIIRTSGTNAAATESGQTGTRKIFTIEDLRKIKTAMNKSNVSKKGRFLVLESNMLDQLEASLGINANRDFSRTYDAANGVIAKLEGFSIMERSFMGVSNSAGSAVSAIGAATGATDQLMSLAFQKDALAKALGEINFFHDEQNPLYYGDVSSADLRYGGRARRTNAEGVYSIIQSTGGE